MRNEVSTVAYWYASVPTAVKDPPEVEKRKPVKKIRKKWLFNKKNQITSREVPLNEEMKTMKKQWAKKHLKKSN